MTTISSNPLLPADRGPGNRPGALPHEGDLATSQIHGRHLSGTYFFISLGELPSTAAESSVSNATEAIINEQFPARVISKIVDELSQIPSAEIANPWAMPKLFAPPFAQALVERISTLLGKDWDHFRAKAPPYELDNRLAGPSPLSSSSVLDDAYTFLSQREGNPNTIHIVLCSAQFLIACQAIEVEGFAPGADLDQLIPKGFPPTPAGEMVTAGQKLEFPSSSNTRPEDSGRHD